ncbi:MAG: DedA family protein [Spirochaetales bacterium]|jgi:membrane protein DedA with SNARE-associated domain|nr:DedA family protein [Spirochaetales bacterium]
MDIFGTLSQYIDFFPLLALVCLLLAGLNVPMSEDIIIITGALLCRKDPDIMVSTLAAIYAGVIISDFMVYWIGTRIRRGVAKTSLMKKVITEKRLNKIHYYLDKFGIFTFIVCRFIPFGVRNSLFMASGILNLRLRTFSLYDITAACISTNTLFFLVYFLGEQIEKPFKTAGIILFTLLVGLIIFFISRLIITWRNELRVKRHEHKTSAC